MDRPSRRQFVQGVGAAGLGLLAGCMQGPARPARIGYLWPFAAVEPEGPARIDAFRRALHDFGYVEGRHLVLEYRYAGGDDRQLPALAAELARLPVAVIVADGTAAALAAQQATTTLPIVMANVPDPEGLGLIASIDRPGGNITGGTSNAPELSKRRLELLQTIVPTLRRLAVVGNPDNPGVARLTQFSQRAAEAAGLGLLALGIRAREDVEPTFETAEQEHADALLVLSDSVTLRLRAALVATAQRRGLTVMYGGREFVTAGGLMACSSDFVEHYQRAAAYVDQILKGARPAELPVERASKFLFVVNLTAARALGLTIPQHVLLQATEVIQ
jgi:putative ABC transport system substrate-binding protein